MSKKKELNPSQVMDASEASDWLKIPKSTLYKLCSEGKLPVTKIGKHWRFHRASLEKWFLEETKVKKNNK